MPSSQPQAANRVPAHVAIIMDGNGRWARKRGLPRLEGHRRGALLVRDVVEWAADAGVRQVSFYTFSTENWSRPRLEVRGLMNLLSMLLPTQVADMQANGVRLLTLGDLSALPAKARRALEQACAVTAGNSRIDAILCLNYGGQQEIVQGVQSYARWLLAQPKPLECLEALTPQGFRDFMWRRELLPVDLLIRTGGERRISNFHLWDAAYAELYFCDDFWPDFSEQHFKEALADYAARERRYGRTSEQVSGR
ncbi:MAG TPA: polyprenyl diphosphate synthase [Mariprofundaceae bacterium]|nr:polyprenyl diphosphate synthase [Mariprofundaceae bacterium]